MAKKAGKWFLLGPLLVIIGAGLWGTESFFRINLNTRYDSEVLVFIEHLFCLTLTLPFFLSGIKHVKKVPRSAWVYVILSGSVGSAIGTTFFTMALKNLNPSVANVLLNFQPVVCVTFAALLLNEKFGRSFIPWALSALVCGMIIATDGFKSLSFTWSAGLVYISITALAWGFSTVAGRGMMMHIPLRVATWARFFVGTVTLLISLTLKGKLSTAILGFHQLSDPFVIKNFIYLSLFAGVLPVFIYFKGLSKTSATVGGFCELTQTFCALLLTWGVLGQPLTKVQVAGGIGLLIAVYMININFAKANKHLAM